MPPEKEEVEKDAIEEETEVTPNPEVDELKERNQFLVGRIDDLSRQVMELAARGSVTPIAEKAAPLAEPDWEEEKNQKPGAVVKYLKDVELPGLKNEIKAMLEEFKKEFSSYRQDNDKRTIIKEIDTLRRQYPDYVGLEARMIEIARANPTITDPSSIYYMAKGEAVSRVVRRVAKVEPAPLPGERPGHPRDLTKIADVKGSAAKAFDQAWAELRLDEGGGTV